MKNHLLVLLINFLVLQSAYAQLYKIDIKIDNLDSGQLLLGFYLNGNTYLKDSAVYLGEGYYSFEGEEKLVKGVYFLAKNTTLMFDFVVGDDQTFTISGDERDLMASIQIAGDKDNQLYFENMKFNLARSEEAKPYTKVLNDSTLQESEKKEAKAALKLINEKVAQHQDEIILNHPNSMLATLLKSGKLPEIPEELAMQDDESSIKLKRQYLRTHYWDQFDLSDPTLLRLPSKVYQNKIDNYLDNLVYLKVDSVIVAIDGLIAKAKDNEETFQNLVWHLTVKYQTSKILGFDEIFVYMVDNYFLTGEMDFWANDQLKKNLKEKADQLRNSLVGMDAPNLILQASDKTPRALYDLKNNYTVVYFYDPDCGHCKRETPILKNFYDSTAYDVGIYTVSADTSMTKMNEYIAEVGIEDWVNTNGTKTYGLNYQEVYDAFATPTLYLLDSRKKIIAKKIVASQLEEVIRKYEQLELKKTSNN